MKASILIFSVFSLFLLSFVSCEKESFKPESETIVIPATPGTRFQEIISWGDYDGLNLDFYLGIQYYRIKNYATGASEAAEKEARKIEIEVGKTLANTIPSVYGKYAKDGGCINLSFGQVKYLLGKEIPGNVYMYAIRIPIVGKNVFLIRKDGLTKDILPDGWVKGEEYSKCITYLPIK